MKHILFLLSYILSLSVFAQQRTIHVPTYSDGTTQYGYTYQSELREKLELEPVQTTDNKWYFRFWTHKQVIDIWETPLGVTKGKITNWAREQTYVDEEPTQRIFYQQEELDPTVLSQLVYLLDSFNLKSIPSDDSIKEWTWYSDGITYTLEMADESDYYFKSYGSPYSQELPEAIIIQHFIDQVNKTANSEAIWSEFTKDIPYQGYCYGNICSYKVVGWWKRRQYKRERKNYIQNQFNL